MDGPLQSAPETHRTDPELRPSGVLDETPLVNFETRPIPEDPALKRRRKRRVLVISLLSLGVVISVALILHSLSSSKQTAGASLEKANPGLQLKAQTTSLPSLGQELTKPPQTTNTLTVNGNLSVSDSIILQPSAKPTDPSAGQLYYDQAANQLGYYNGVGFVYLQGAGGASSVTNNFITNVTNASGGALSGTGQAGQIALFNSPSTLQGSLLSQSNTTLSAAGSLHLQSTANSAAALQVKNAASQNAFTVDTTNNQLILGNDSATPTTTTIRGGAGVGNNITGANLTIQGSNGTGGANGGDIILETGQSAQGGIQLDNAAKVISTGGPLSMSFTVGTKQGRLLLVMANYAATGVTYDGRPLTSLASVTSGQGFASGVQANLWYLVNPPSGTFTLSTTNGGAGTTIGASSYYNVDQTNPLGAPVTAIGANAGTQATSLSITTNNTSQVVFDGFALDRDSSLDSCTPHTSGETVRWTVSQLFFTTGCGADVAANGGLMNLSWQSSQADWAEAAVVINPAVPASTPLQLISGSDPNALFDRLHITATGNVGINNSNPQYTLDVNGITSSSAAVYSPVFDTINPTMLTIGNFNASSIQLGDISSNIATTIMGTAIIKPTPGNDSATDFQIQNAGGTSLFIADTAGLRINIVGTTSAFATLNLTNAHFTTTQTTAPTVATPTNCGTSPSAAVTAGSTDIAGSFTITAGSGSPTTCDATITFNKTFGSTPKSIVLTPTLAVGSATGSLTARVSAVNATSFTVQLAPTNPAAGAVYSFYYTIAG